MKVQFKVNKRITVEAEGDDVKAIFKQIHGMVESFGTGACGCCGSDNIQPAVRTNGKFNYYEWHCKEIGCRAKLSMGQGEKELYPRIKYHEQHPDVKSGKVKEGDYISSNGKQTGGWEIYKGKRDE